MGNIPMKPGQHSDEHVPGGDAVKTTSGYVTAKSQGATYAEQNPENKPIYQDRNRNTFKDGAVPTKSGKNYLGQDIYPKPARNY